MVPLAQTAARFQAAHSRQSLKTGHSREGLCGHCQDALPTHVNRHLAPRNRHAVEELLKADVLIASDGPRLQPGRPTVFLGSRVVVFTAGPARMADNFDIDLPHPRTLDMKTHEKFGEYTRRIYRLLGME